MVFFTPEVDFFPVSLTSKSSNQALKTTFLILLQRENKELQNKCISECVRAEETQQNQLISAGDNLLTVTAPSHDAG